MVYERISIHALREESDLPGKQWSENLRISIHALREESDGNISCEMNLIDAFQSTLSVRRATIVQPCRSVSRIISIHALREESDSGKYRRQPTVLIFQSTLSVRRATAAETGALALLEFQSTLSVRRATVQLDIFVRFLRRKPAA